MTKLPLIHTYTRRENGFCHDYLVKPGESHSDAWRAVIGR
jgi:hypothetical protein